MPETILIFGSNGQIGTVLTAALIDRHGKNKVFATDISDPRIDLEHFEIVDVTDAEKVDSMVEKVKPTRIYHLAAILSASGEKNPEFTWKVNVQGTLNVMESARKHNVERFFYPSTIAVFGSTTPKINTPQASPLLPETVYGMSKVAGENWANYYHMRYGMDIRSIRYPGVLGYQSIPHGGTTDYAVEIYHAAIKGEEYACFLEADTYLPMIYMSDAIKATLDLMDADSDLLSVRYSYNLTGMSFSPADIADEIRKIIPDFKIKYVPDFRQEIAASWSQSIDDSQARLDWNWVPEYDLVSMTEDMINNIRKQY